MNLPPMRPPSFEDSVLNLFLFKLSAACTSFIGAIADLGVSARPKRFSYELFPGVTVTFIPEPKHVTCNPGVFIVRVGKHKIQIDTYTLQHTLRKEAAPLLQVISKYTINAQAEAVDNLGVFLMEQYLAVEKVAQKREEKMQKALPGIREQTIALLPQLEELISSLERRNPTHPLVLYAREYVQWMKKEAVNDDLHRWIDDMATLIHVTTRVQAQLLSKTTALFLYGPVAIMADPLYNNSGITSIGAAVLVPAKGARARFTHILRLQLDEQGDMVFVKMPFMQTCIQRALESDVFRMFDLWKWMLSLDQSQVKMIRVFGNDSDEATVLERAA